ncbi:hypothetical protein [Serratia rubidaea]|uniref:Uncharacterized protein n=1 Tax=Serratia rubidaea TaxID=61652 RepID=A0A448SRM1_SERRU|nr:hypothetical protein [Serratia rubidaea]VEI70358.1 Uncharacterised protein [Serratia rubidaea]
MKRTLLSLVAFVVLDIILMFILTAVLPKKMVYALAERLDIYGAEGIIDLYAYITIPLSLLFAGLIVWIGNHRFR